jgi:Tol biopolymer transport system component
VFGAVALSPDGLQLAYTVVSYRDDGIEAGTELVIRDLGGGAILVSRIVGKDGEQIDALSFDGRRVLYQRRSAGAVAVFLQPITGQVAAERLTMPSTVSGLNSVSLARLPVATGR